MKCKKWWQTHINNIYYKLAQKQNYRSRAWFKLHEIQQKEKILTKGQKVLDLGASPGAWSQYISKIIFPNGKLIACDLLFMSFIKNVQFIQGDIRKIYILNKIKNSLNYQKLDVIVSDIAPNISGINIIDKQLFYNLLITQLHYCVLFLKKKGTFITKIFINDQCLLFKQKLKHYFKLIKCYKPKASNKFSQEIYLISKYFLVYNK